MSKNCINIGSFFESNFNSKPVTISGTADGYKLGNICISACSETEKEVSLDFIDVLSVSYSTSCAFWDILINRSSVKISRLLFENLNPTVAESLEYGYKMIKNPIGHQVA